MAWKAAARALVVGPVLALGACSSIPDVTFEDDAGISASVDADASSTDAGVARDAGWSCPGNPPPREKGVCCGEDLCLNCTQAHCKSCRDRRCDADEVCCGRFLFGPSAECRRASSSCQ